MTVILRNTALPFQNPLRLFGPNMTQDVSKWALLKEQPSLRTNLLKGKNNSFEEQKKTGANSHNIAPKANNNNWKSGKLNLAGENNYQKKRELLMGNFSALLASSLFSLAQPISLSIRNFTKNGKDLNNYQNPVTKKKPTTIASADKSGAGVQVAPSSCF